MKLETTYMGLKLKNPLVPSASPLSKEIANISHEEAAWIENINERNIIPFHYADAMRALEAFKLIRNTTL